VSGTEDPAATTTTTSVTATNATGIDGTTVIGEGDAPLKAKNGTSYNAATSVLVRNELLPLAFQLRCNCVAC
jgi:hypothetical protein